MATLGVLLAGGRGERMGVSQPKALARCAGTTLLARALATLSEVCDTVVVVAPAEMELPIEDALRVNDPPGAAGPLAGLVAGLAARPCDEALVLAVDLPLVTASLLAALRRRRGHAAVLVPAPGGIPQPLAAWYAAAALASLTRALAAGERSVTRAVLALSPVLLDDATLATLPGGLLAWLNVNTPADLAAAERAVLAGAQPGSEEY